MARSRFQFNTRHLLVASTFVCIAVATMASLARHFPEIIVLACFASLFVGLYGIGVLILAAVIAFSISAKEPEPDRKLQLAKCRSLAIIGGVMIAAPIALTSLTVVFLSLAPAP